jgi:hypothetical protein
MTDDGSDESHALFERLRLLQRETGKDKNQQAINLIAACIAEEGINTRAHLIGVLRHLLDYRQVAIILKMNQGPNPKLHLWQLHEDGRYRLHPRTVD